MAQSYISIPMSFVSQSNIEILLLSTYSVPLNETVCRKKTLRNTRIQYGARKYEQQEYHIIYYNICIHIFLILLGYIEIRRHNSLELGV